MQNKGYACYNHPTSNLVHHQRIFFLKSPDSSYSCKRSQNSSRILSTKHPQAHTTLIISAFWFLTLVLQCKYSVVMFTSLNSPLAILLNVDRFLIFEYIQNCHIHLGAFTCTKHFPVVVPENKSYLCCQSAPALVFSFVAQ